MSGNAYLTGEGTSRRLTPEGLVYVETLASEGKTGPEIAIAIGVSRDNWNRLLKASPEARSRWEHGKNLKRRTPASLAMVVPGRNGRALEIKPAGLEVCRVLASRGVSNPTIAASLGITKAQLTKAIEADPAVAQAIEAGRGELEKFAIGKLIDLAEKGVPSCVIFLCKNVAGYSDEGPRNKGTTTNVQIVLNAAKSREDYLKSITVEAESNG